MELLILVGLVALNFGISWWNCYAVGGIWAESKALGGVPRLLAWCGAIQAAIGFSSVLVILLAFGASAAGALPPKAMSAAMSLWYLLVIVPALGTGLALTVHSWIAAYRERSLSSMGVASWNTFSQAYNMYQAVEGIGSAFGDVTDFFFSDDNENPAAGLVLLLVVVALAGGALLTWALIRRYSGRLPIPADDVRARPLRPADVRAALGSGSGMALEVKSSKGQTTSRLVDVRSQAQRQSDAELMRDEYQRAMTPFIGRSDFATVAGVASAIVQGVSVADLVEKSGIKTVEAALEMMRALSFEHVGRGFEFMADSTALSIRLVATKMLSGGWTVGGEYEKVWIYGACRFLAYHVKAAEQPMEVMRRKMAMLDVIASHSPRRATNERSPAPRRVSRAGI